ncbi:MAG: hypothetical protein JWO38_8068 [Gemmataceae bacterium]|nr:hypothetical protein [Gemmataceae bacterium]
MFTGLALVVAAQLGMGLAVETMKPEWRDPEYGHRLHQIRRLRDAHPDRPLVVAVGSSRTLMGLSPAAMGFPDEPGSPLVYNFGQTGAGPLQILLTTFRLLDAGVKPAFLLVELFPAALVGDGPAEDMMKLWGPRLGAGDVRRLAPYAAHPAAVQRTWAGNRLAPWYSLRLTLMNHWRPGWLPTANRIDFQWDRLDPRGWLAYPHDAVPAAEREKNVARAGESYVRQLAGYRIGATSDRALRDILVRCKAGGIPVAFYLTPEGPAFGSWYPPGARETLAAYLGALRREYEVPVFDAAGGFGEAEFADSHHLLPGGAARFSRRLADEYVRGWVSGGQ